MFTPNMSRPPDHSALREAALAHLARYEATEAGLLRVLARRILRWARGAATSAEGMETAEIERMVADAEAEARRVVASLATAGGVDDRRFAASRARRHAREGKSARASQAHLSASGIPAPLAREAAARDGDRELDAAVAHASRRRLGPFAAKPDPDEAAAARAARRHRTLASFARAGFSSATAQAALRLDRAEAEARLHRLRSE